LVEAFNVQDGIYAIQMPPAFSVPEKELWNRLAADKYKEISNAQNAALKRAHKLAGKNINVHIITVLCVANNLLLKQPLYILVSSMRKNTRIFLINVKYFQPVRPNLFKSPKNQQCRQLLYEYFRDWLESSESRYYSKETSEAKRDN
jgi:hypothetical protein